MKYTILGKENFQSTDWSWLYKGLVGVKFQQHGLETATRWKGYKRFKDGLNINRDFAYSSKSEGPYLKFRPDQTFPNRHPTLRKKVVLMAHHSTSIYWRNQPCCFLIIPGKPHAYKTQPFKNYATTRIFLTSASSSACAVEVCRSANVVSGEYWVENASERQVRLLLSLVAMTLVLNATT